MRGHFVALVIAVGIPAIVLAAALLWWQTATERGARERHLQDRALGLSQSVEREMRVAIAALETLRHSDALLQGDIGGFATLARRVHAENRHWLSIVLTAKDGQQVLNLAATPGQPLPNIAHYEVIQSALAGRASVSELLVGRVRKVHLVGFDVPVTIDGEVRYALGLSMPASHFQKLLDEYPRQPDWIFGLVDHKGIIVARTAEPEAGVGTPTAEMWRNAPGTEGVLHGVGRLGVPVIGAYARSSWTGWTTIASVPAASLYSGRDRALSAVFVGGLALLAAGLLVALFFGRRAIAPIEALARSAEVYVRGEAPDLILRRGLAEADHLAEALVDAGRKQRAAEEQRDEARAQLFQAQKMEAVGHLTGGVAHDFNNLLTIIMGSLDMAKRALESGSEGAQLRVATNINRALEGGKRASVLTGQLLAFSRRQPLQPCLLDVNKLLRHLGEFLTPSLGEMVQLETVEAAGQWKIEVDQGQLEAALLNLAVNARDAMPDGGRVTIEAANVFLDQDYCVRHGDVKPGQYVMLSVTDTGTGMPKEVIERAIEPFFTTKEVGRGTGLGLSQVYGFVKQSGGHFKIYSEPGQGTTVRIYLPRSYAAAEEAEHARIAAPTSGNETILVVEDDPDVRTFVTESLRELQYSVIEAPDASAALDILRKVAPVHLLLTDVVLPSVNGRELAEKAVAQLPSLKVLYMTGYSRNAIIYSGRLDPGIEMIEKPLTQTALAAKVRSVLDHAPAG
jgi:signal transduction histidine kinase